MSISVPLETLNPTPRPAKEGSGGYVEIAVVKGLEAHRMRFHVRPFDVSPRETSTFVVPGAFFTSTTVTVLDDMPYLDAIPPTDPGQTVETHIGHTLYNLSTLIARFYSNAWRIVPVKCVALFADPLYVDNLPTRAHPYPFTAFDCDPLPQILAPVETGLNGTPSGAPASMIAMQLKSPAVVTPGDPTHGIPPSVLTPAGRGRVTLLDSAEWANSGIPSKIGGTWASGSDDLEQFLGYLACTTDCPAAGGVVLHNGLRPSPGAKIVNRFYQRSMRRLLRTIG